MANEEQLAILKSGVEAWNAGHWSTKTRGLISAKRTSIGRTSARAVLIKADLTRANLTFANLDGADLSFANLTEANLRWAFLRWADLSFANLDGALLSGAQLMGAELIQAVLRRADLDGALLHAADLTWANLSFANLTGADLSRADLTSADLTSAVLRRADLSRVVLVGTHLEGTDLTSCRVYGIAAWDLKLNEFTQVNLIITPEDQPTITVDNLEVAQFVYLLLNNRRIRHVIDTITGKVVLILGRFSEERKVVLDALRDELRQRDYLPVLFDFDKPESRDLTETIQTLAAMARFVIADLTDAKSLPQELTAIVPNLPSVAIQPLLLEGATEYAMFEHWRRFPWVLPEYRYEHIRELLDALTDHVIAPAEAKVAELRGETSPLGRGKG